MDYKRLVKVSDGYRDGVLGKLRYFHQEFRRDMAELAAGVEGSAREYVLRCMREESKIERRAERGEIIKDVDVIEVRGDIGNIKGEVESCVDNLEHQLHRLWIEIPEGDDRQKVLIYIGGMKRMRECEGLHKEDE